MFSLGPFSGYIDRCYERQILGGFFVPHSYVVQAELLKLQRRGQFPDEFVKICVTQIHYVVSQT
jgi:hypothetical protein